MEILFAADVAAEVSRRLGRPVTPREVTALFYHKKVPDELGPITGGRRLIRPEAVEIITDLLK
jgi:hypothetical protein